MRNNILTRSTKNNKKKTQKKTSQRSQKQNKIKRYEQCDVSQTAIATTITSAQPSTNPSKYMYSETTGILLYKRANNNNATLAPNRQPTAEMKEKNVVFGET